MSALLCACGCKTPVGRGRGAIYATETCKWRAAAARRRVSRLTLMESGATSLPRMKPTTHRVLRRCHRELSQPDVGGLRFGARLLELREMGFKVDARAERPGSWRYRLVSTPATERLFDATPDRRAA